MVGQAQVQISREFDCFCGVCRFKGDLIGSWTCFQRGFDRFPEGSLTGFYGFLGFDWNLSVLRGNLAVPGEI